jgi:hypothetical protein
MTRATGVGVRNGGCDYRELGERNDGGHDVDDWLTAERDLSWTRS